MVKSMKLLPLVVLCSISLAAIEIKMETAHPGAIFARQRLEQQLAEKDVQVKLRMSKGLRDSEYRITPDDKGIVCEGGSPKGLYYGAVRLEDELKKGKDITEEISASPKWEHIYAADQRGYFPSRDNLLSLAEHGIQGYAWLIHWHDWKEFKPEKKLDAKSPAVGECLEMIRELSKLEIMDFMVLFHIYNSNTKPPLNIASDEQLKAFADTLRLAASNGVKHIMICADDYTKFNDNRYVCTYPEEAQKFDDSVGKAHGYLCKFLWNELHEEFPELELSFVPAPYSLLDHKTENEGNVKYMKEWDESAPEEIMLVWTGPKIIPDIPMEKDHFDRYKVLIPNHKLIYWDNGECIDHPWPKWMARMYAGAAKDHEGIVLINGHGFCWPDCLAFLVSGADYLWTENNEESFVDSFARISKKLYGDESAELLIETTKLVSDYKKLPNAEWHLTTQPEILTRLEELNKAIGEKNLSTFRLDGWIKRMKTSVFAERPKYDVPFYKGEVYGENGILDSFKNAALHIPLASNFGDLYLAHDADSLKIAFYGTPKAGITPEKVTSADNKMGICYDSNQLGIGDAKGGPVFYSRNAVGEWTGTEMNCHSRKDNDSFQMFYDIPYDELEKLELTDFRTSGQLLLYYSRITYTVNHYGISPKSIPAYITLLPEK